MQQYLSDMDRCIIIALIAVLMLSVPPCISASVVINEFATDSPQKVELYNTGPDVSVLNIGRNKVSMSFKFYFGEFVC